RSAVVAILAAALFAAGCASQPTTFIPPGEDPNKLLEAIAKNGQPSGVVEPVATDKPDPLTVALVGSVKVATKVALTCLATAALVGLAYGHAPQGDGLWNVIYRIWVDD